MWPNQQRHSSPDTKSVFIHVDVSLREKTGPMQEWFKVSPFVVKGGHRMLSNASPEIFYFKQSFFNVDLNQIKRSGVSNLVRERLCFYDARKIHFTNLN